MPAADWDRVPSGARPVCGYIVCAVDLFAGVTEDVRTALVGVTESERALLESCGSRGLGSGGARR